MQTAAPILPTSSHSELNLHGTITIIWLLGDTDYRSLSVQSFGWRIQRDRKWICISCFLLMADERGQVTVIHVRPAS